MICMFDLPVDNAVQQRAYRRFRKDIMSEGFVMIQYSVYVRTCPNREFADRLEKRLRKVVPAEGNVRLLTVTEKQFDEMKLIVGSRKSTETALGIERMIVI